MVPSCEELLRVSEQLSEQLHQMKKDAKRRTQQIGRTQEDDLNPVNMSFTCYQDNISEVEQVSSEYEQYVPTETEDSFEMFPNNNLEQIEVDVTTTAHRVLMCPKMTIIFPAPKMQLK